MERNRDFAHIAEQHLADVYGYLVYLTASPELAQELTSAAFEKALRSFERFDRGGPAPGRGCARSRVPLRSTISAPRTAGAGARTRNAVQQEFDVREPAFAEGLSPELERALGELTAAEREVIALRVVLELDADEAARLLGVSKTACTTRLSRALQKLHEKVANDVLA